MPIISISCGTTLRVGMYGIPPACIDTHTHTYTQHPADDACLVLGRSRDDSNPLDGKTRACDRERMFETFVGDDMKCGNSGEDVRRGKGFGFGKLKGVFGRAWGKG